MSFISFLCSGIIEADNEGTECRKLLGLNDIDVVGLTVVNCKGIGAVYFRNLPLLGLVDRKADVVCALCPKINEASPFCKCVLTFFGVYIIIKRAEKCKQWAEKRKTVRMDLFIRSGMSEGERNASV